MFAKLTFLGAAETVTGSRYLIDVAGTSLLIDCCMVHERDLANRNWDHFPVHPSRVTSNRVQAARMSECGCRLFMSFLFRCEAI